MENCTGRSKKSERDYQTQYYSKEKQELLDHLPEWLKVLRDFYLKYKL